MSLPGMLIIGGMKCGSTTLYRDLAASPDIFFPLDKEPGNLTSNHVLTDTGREEYESLFERAGPSQISAEASTNYTKRPIHDGVAERAYEVLGPKLKVIYIIREPLGRVVSHMNHNISNGEWESQSPFELIRNHRELVQFSSYGHQVSPWVEQFGPDHVRVVRLDDYMQNRRARCVELWNWLGVNPNPEGIDDGRAYNSSSAKPVLKGPFAWVPGNPIYKKLIRPLFSNRLRDRIRHFMLPKNKVARLSLDRESEREVLRLLDDQHELMGSFERSCFLGPDVCWSDWYSGKSSAKEESA
jgi:hypothetical protein